MAKKVFSSFWYGHVVTAENRYLDFIEDGDSLPRVAILNIKSYSASDFVLEVARAMSEAGSQDYTCVFDRETRLATISAEDKSFTLLTSTGENSEQSIFPLLGFSNIADFENALEFEGDIASGKVFRPQMWLQGYTPFENWIEHIGASVVTLSTGRKIGSSFGTIRKMECSLDLVTDLAIGVSQGIETQAGAIANLRDFLSAITSLQVVEFMEDRDDVATYVRCQCDGVPGYNDGMGFKLVEKFKEKLPDFFQFGPIVFTELK